MKKITANDPLARSADIIARNIEQIRNIFPESLSDGKIDFDVLKQLLGDAIGEHEEKYGLNWCGKRRARDLSLALSIGTLRPCPEDSINWNTTQNLMIEGDNLEVLKLLQKSYSGKVKLIYIDPPYNTGKDFVYPDDFKDNIKNYLELTGQTEGGKKISSNTEASGRFHTAWLNMMYPRVKLAHGLLRNDGVMLTSIDDNEIGNLRQLYDEIFGEENFVACMIWEKGRKNDAKFVSIGHEYLLVYAKSQAHLRETKTQWREEKPGAKDIWEQYLMFRAKHGQNESLIERDLQQWFSSLDKTHPAKKWSRYKRVDANGPWRDRDISWPGGGGPRYDVLHPKTGLPCKVPESGWRYANPEEMQRQIALGLVVFRDDHMEPPFRKAHIRPITAEVDIEELVTPQFDNSTDDSSVSDNSETEEEFATQVRGSYFYKQSQVAVKYLRKLLGAKAFDNPKDHFELAKLFDYVTANDRTAIVLDFFAGSASSAHAVMELNRADSGSRRYIVVQLPEQLEIGAKEQEPGAKYCDMLGKPRTIAEITKERIRRAAKMINDEKPHSIEDLGFRVFKLDSSNIRAWEPDHNNLDQALLESLEHIKPNRSEADILYELLLKLGLDLSVPIEKRGIAGKDVHAVGGGVLLACLAEKITRDDAEPLALGIIAWHNALAPAGESTCIFRDSAFVDDVAKTNLAAILQQHGLQNVRSL